MTKLNELRQGDVVLVDGGFTCMQKGRQTVQADSAGLYVECREGKHYLAGQEDRAGADLVGVELPPLITLSQLLSE